MLVRIRDAKSADLETIRALHLRAFAADENQQVAELAVELSDNQSDPETLSLVAVHDAAIVAHIAFSPVRTESKPDWLGYVLAPLGVDPAHQRSGIGRRLIDWGLERLTKANVDVVFVYGDPKYYAKFGFDAKAAQNYIAPYRLEYPFGWQAMVLERGTMLAQEVKITCVPALCDPALW